MTVPLPYTDIEICLILAAKNNKNIKTNQAQHDKTKPIKSIFTRTMTMCPQGIHICSGDSVDYFLINKYVNQLCVAEIKKMLAINE